MMGWKTSDPTMMNTCQVSSNYCFAKSNICCKQRSNWQWQWRGWKEEERKCMVSQYMWNRCLHALGKHSFLFTNQSFKLQGFYQREQLWQVVCSHLRNGFCHWWLDTGWSKRNLTIRNEGSLIWIFVKRMEERRRRPNWSEINQMGQKSRKGVINRRAYTIFGSMIW